MLTPEPTTPRPLRAMLLGSLAAYILIPLVASVGGWVGVTLGCDRGTRDPNGQMACTFAWALGAGVGVVIAGFALLLIGLKLRLRGWWLPCLFGVAWLLIVIEMPWVAFAVPVVASRLSAPLGTPAPAKRTMTVIAAIVSVVAGGASLAAHFLGR